MVSVGSSGWHDGQPICANFLRVAQCLGVWHRQNKIVEMTKRGQGATSIAEMASLEYIIIMVPNSNHVQEIIKINDIS